MTRRRRRLIVALAVLAVCGVLALPGVHWRLVGWWRGEPSYQGRPVVYWSSYVRKYGDGLPLANEHGGRYYVRPYDPLAGLKRAVGLASAYDPTVDRELPFVGPDPDAVPVLTALLADPAPAVRGYAAWAVRRFPEEGLGEAARPAVPALRRLIADDARPFLPSSHRSVGDIAAQALDGIDPDALKETAGRP